MTDESKILLLDLGRSDGEANRLIGSLVVTGLELAMRRRRNRKLWNLTIRGFQTKPPDTIRVRQFHSPGWATSRRPLAIPT